MSTLNLSGMLYEVEQSVPKTYWAQRIIEELSYMLELSRVRNGELDALLISGVQLLRSRVAVDQAVTPATVHEIEDMLADLSAEAKSLAVICTANAHIDMNWMWGYQETVALTVDTVRTVLTLMEEYPDFVYTQPQASVYAILEEYAPELIETIRMRVKEGRWEASVSGWVEEDKNMVSSESLARHLLYARRYISELLEIPVEKLDLDFAPDTFGHGCHVPELLNQGGIKYYYHCRGHQGDNFFRWRAPSGAEILAFREPTWYNLSFDYGMFRHVPQFCGKYGVDITLGIYGVGDHGGGPTRRDLERIRDMQTWPLFPTLKHGSVREFFRHIEAFRDKFPVIDHELNYVFTGCYTSQSRIKRANRYGEAKLCEAEALDVMARTWVPEYSGAKNAEKNWRKILFNHFHDILPGSGTVETKEFSMGQFQKAMAWTETTAKQAMQRIASKICGKHALPEVGVGIYACDANGYGVSQTGFTGDSRYYMLFNATARERSELTELMLWDWQHAPEHICITDEYGTELPYQVIDTGTIFWGHSFCKIALPVTVPAMGYCVCNVSYRVPKQVFVPVNPEPREDTYADGNLVLENEKIKAEFRRETMQCVSLIHKETNKQLVDQEKPSCGFELVTEDPAYAMTSWRLGPTCKSVNLNQTQKVFVTNICTGQLRQSITYHLNFERSRVEVTIALDAGSEKLDFAMKIDWNELGTPESSIPLLRFPVSIGYDHGNYRYLTAGGIVDRPAIGHDVPSLGLVCAVADTGMSMALLSDCKYGFRSFENTMYVSLIRSPYDPDPCPDQGTHYVKLSLWLGTAEAEALHHAAMCMTSPIMSCVLPTEEEPESMESNSLLKLDGGSMIAVKPTEDQKGLLLRIANSDNETHRISAQFCRMIKRAYLTDVHEALCEELCTCGNQVAWEMKPETICSLVVMLEKAE